MSFDLDPVELLTCALTAVLVAIPIAFPLAAAAIAGPRRIWNGAGLAMGIGLLLGVLLAGVGVVANPPVPLEATTMALQLLGLLGALVAAVLVVVLAEGNRTAAALGITACGLIGLSEPVQTLPAMFGLSTSVLVVLAAVVIEAVALVVIVGALVAVAGRARAFRIGIAAASAVSALLLGLGLVAQVLREGAGVDAPVVPLSILLIAVLAALVLGSLAGGVVESVRARRRRPAHTAAG